MPTREHVVNEIRRVAEKYGRPPGRQLFERETGIAMADWYGAHFRSWGDALVEAGYEPNEKQDKLSREHVLREYAKVVRHFGRVPAMIDLRMYSRERPEVPGHTTFTNHFGNKAGLDAALAKWVREQGEFQDLVSLLPGPTESPRSGEVAGVPDGSLEASGNGWVYLLKSGDHYKIGHSQELERRVKEIRVAMPQETTLMHSIRTDDPSGIEAYWHRRFERRRANGEWFRLTAADVRAFKRRKFQ
ncbi:MAG: GIY-YIG nuclease family protein [Acidobacteria bacterium]|nr:GIY-YIG nuclease family protein [Acidobacteriota bacterium]